MKSKWKSDFVIMLLISVCILALTGCRKQELSEPIEHNTESRLIYFTAIDGENDINIEMEEGEGEILVAMDFGELSLTLASEDGEVILDTDATFSSEYTVSIPRTGTYVLTLKGNDASGSVNY